MSKVSHITSKIFTIPGIMQRVLQWRVVQKRIAFTNGVFDILHAGHIKSLMDAANEGDYLIVGLNTDLSVKRLKGTDRPFLDETTRSLMLASLLMVDAVVLFDDDTPLHLIEGMRPDVLVKGGDYTVDQIVGAKEVQAYGGRVVINSLLEGYSSSAIIEQMNLNTRKT